MYEDVRAKMKRKNKIFFSRESLCLQPLIALICKQNHRTLVLWALELAEKPLAELETAYPEEVRLRACIAAATAWARGEVKMPVAKRAILDAHAVAKEIADPAHQALCHAIGHAAATVHVETHAVGLAFYELTALVLQNEDWEAHVTARIAEYEARLLYWSTHTDDNPRPWAAFLLKDTENKEQKLHEKRIL